jgi:hypothetical protein
MMLRHLRNVIAMFESGSNRNIHSSCALFAKFATYDFLTKPAFAAGVVELCFAIGPITQTCVGPRLDDNDTD